MVGLNHSTGLKGALLWDGEQRAESNISVHVAQASGKVHHVFITTVAECASEIVFSMSIFVLFIFNGIVFLLHTHSLSHTSALLLPAASVPSSLRSSWNAFAQPGWSLWFRSCHSTTSDGFIWHNFHAADFDPLALIRYLFVWIWYLFPKYLFIKSSTASCPQSNLSGVVF